MAVSLGLCHIAFNDIPSMVGFLAAVHLCWQATKKRIKWPVLQQSAALAAWGTNAQQFNEVFSE
jgi:hypothetical protein